VVLTSSHTLRSVPGADKRSGVAAVEFAFLAPILVLAIVGSIDFGRQMMVASTLTSAAREGVRKGISPNATQTDAQTAVTAYLTDTSIPTTNATTTVTVKDVNGTSKPMTNAVNGDTVTVEVLIPVADVMWLPFASWWSAGKQLRGVATMRRE
jgi:Flp pilus assembly protein TadG